MKIKIHGHFGNIALGSISREQYTYWNLVDDEDQITNMLKGNKLEDEHPQELLLSKWEQHNNIVYEHGVWLETCVIDILDNNNFTILYDTLTHFIRRHNNRMVENKMYYHFDNTTYKFGILSFKNRYCSITEYESLYKFNPNLLEISIIDVEGHNIVNGIRYDGELLTDI